MNMPTMKQTKTAVKELFVLLSIAVIWKFLIIDIVTRGLYESKTLIGVGLVETWIILWTVAFIRLDCKDRTEIVTMSKDEIYWRSATRMQKFNVVVVAITLAFGIWTLSVMYWTMMFGRPVTP